MLLSGLRQQVLAANLDLVSKGLAFSTFGNVSGICREQGLIVIKPSGFPYDQMKEADLVVTDLEGRVVEGSMRPSSDLPTHAALYRSFSTIGGVAHTHSRYATAWAQARAPIPCYGTTHADYFHGDIPVTYLLTREEIETDYELNTGRAIVGIFDELDPLAIPGVLVANHAPFTWGLDAAEAVAHSSMLEEIAHLAYLTVAIDPKCKGIPKRLHSKHFLRKHGKASYYGQPKGKT